MGDIKPRHLLLQTSEFAAKPSHPMLPPGEYRQKCSDSAFCQITLVFGLSLLLLTQMVTQDGTNVVKITNHIRE